MLHKDSKVKIIFHIDINAYFASVAAILNPKLNKEVFAVGKGKGLSGMITSPSYKARSKGIKAAMLYKDALRIYPNLVLVDVEYSKFEEYNKKFVEYIKKYSPLVQVGSIDEVYADMTNACQQEDALNLAKRIQDGLLKEIGLPCSIGIGPTLFLAKMGSDYKKPLGITIIRKKDVPKKILPLDISEMYGVGVKTANRLKTRGLNYIGDLVKEENEEKILGVMTKNNYNNLISYLKGRSNDVVEPNKYALSETIGVSRTFSVALEREEDLLEKIDEQVEIIHKRLMDEKRACKTITLTLKNTAYKTINRSRSIPDYTDDKKLIAFILKDLLDDNFTNTSYRLMGCALNNLIKKSNIPAEYNLFTYEKFIVKSELVDEVVDKINKAYDKAVISKGIK